MRHNIALVCDFFHPRLGGVEMHIWSLAQCLIARNHHVIVITHAYKGTNHEDDRKGIRYMSKGLKIYYLPIVPFFDQVVFPTFYSWIPLFRDIMIREEITIVHGQSATSCMTNEAILMGKAMGLHTCYTDHSLFGFGDVASLNINKVIRFTLSDVDAIICVSNSCLQNLVKRACIRNPEHVCHILPNAIDPSQFTPLSRNERDTMFRKSGGRVIIVVISRLTFRKGTDLLIDMIPEVCNKFPEIDFIIGGDGPKKLKLEKMLIENNLMSRVEMLGSVLPCNVPEVLKRGHIFLNCSLTESFCIAIVEAACSGLFIVSTNVGGITEVLPQTSVKQHGREHFTRFVPPSKQDLLEAISDSIQPALVLDPFVIHEKVKKMYSWPKVAYETEKIYDSICKYDNYEDKVDRFSGGCYQKRLRTCNLISSLRKYRTCGPFAGILACIVVTFISFLLFLLEIFRPEKDIEPAVKWSQPLKKEGKIGLDEAR